MTIEEIMSICRRLKGVTSDIKWEDHLCFNIGSKMFLITSPDNLPPTASFKVSDRDFEMLTEREGINPASYLARHKWVAVDDINRLTLKEWECFLLQSYSLIASKLPKKLKAELDLDLDLDL